MVKYNLMYVTQFMLGFLRWRIMIFMFIPSCNNVYVYLRKVAYTV
jgi:hypothetical protein